MDREPHQTAAADFEAIRADLRATARLQKKVQRQINEMVKEGKERRKEYDRKFGDLSNRWGRFVESLVEGDLVAMLRKKGIDVFAIGPHLRGERDGEHFEFDIVAVNGEEVVVVEVKSTLRAGDVRHFLSKLEKFTKWVPHHRGSKVYGAVAYLQVVQSAEIHAERQGLFVIRATGNSASIINGDGFLPRAFH